MDKSCAIPSAETARGVLSNRVTADSILASSGLFRTAGIAGLFAFAAIAGWPDVETVWAFSWPDAAPTAKNIAAGANIALLNLLANAILLS